MKMIGVLILLCLTAQGHKPPPSDANYQCASEARMIDDFISSLDDYTRFKIPESFRQPMLRVNRTATRLWAPELGLVDYWPNTPTCAKLYVTVLLLEEVSNWPRQPDLYKRAKLEYDLLNRRIRFPPRDSPAGSHGGPVPEDYKPLLYAQAVEIWKQRQPQPPASWWEYFGGLIQTNYVSNMWNEIRQIMAELWAEIEAGLTKDQVLLEVKVEAERERQAEAKKTEAEVKAAADAAAKKLEKEKEIEQDTKVEPTVVATTTVECPPCHPVYVTNCTVVENIIHAAPSCGQCEYTPSDIPTPPKPSWLLNTPFGKFEFHSNNAPKGILEKSGHALLRKASDRVLAIWKTLSWYLVLNHWVARLLPTNDVGLRVWYHRYVVLSGSLFTLYALADLGIALTVLNSLIWLTTIIFGYAQLLYWYYWMRSGSRQIGWSEWLFEAKIIIMWMHTLLTNRTIKHREADPNKLRGFFNDCPDIKQRQADNHTHPVSAADRNSSSLFADHLAAQLGLTPYYVQCSKADLRRGRLGSRKWYWSKDLTTAEHMFAPPQNSLLVLTDVDQYMDMNEFLSRNTHPVLIYTFQPGQCSADRGDYCYTFTNDVVNYRVAGGGLYQHMVWNWSAETITASWKIAGIPAYSTAYLIDRRQTDADHQYIFLSPIGSWYGSSPSNQKISNHELARIHMSQGNGYNRMLLQKRDGCMISTGREGLYTSALVSVTVDNAIQLQMEEGKHPMSLGAIKTMMPGRDNEAVVIHSYFNNVTTDKPAVMCPVAAGVRNYQYAPRQYDGDAKPSLVPFMSPLLHGAFAPDKTKANEKSCIEQRITKVKSPVLPTTPFISLCMQEFCEHFISNADKQKLIPVEVSEVWDNMIRPTQRLGLLESLARTSYKFITETFMKAEAYANCKPPRNISTIDPKLKLEYSTITYALTNVLKKHKWYAFGKNPKQIATRVAHVCNNAQFVVNSDFSKFDGHVSNLLRDFELMVMMRAFHPMYHEKVRECHAAQYKIKGVAKFGTKYDTDYTRLSGSPETALFNSIDNAFVAYLAFRFAKLEPKTAFASLGIYGGDDGLTADLPTTTYKQAATAIGQVLTTERVLRGELGVKFLARLYSPHVWEGDINSVCDIKRQAAKFHTTVGMPPNVTPTDKLLEKVRCVLLSDRNTPVIGDFARKVSQVFGGEIKSQAVTTALIPWFAKTYVEMDEQYPNDVTGWVYDVLKADLPGYDYKKFLRHLDGCKTLDALMHLPLFAEPTEPESEVDVMVNGDLFGPTAKLFQDPPLETKHKRAPSPALETKAESKYATKASTTLPSTEKRVQFESDALNKFKDEKKALSPKAAKVDNKRQPCPSDTELFADFLRIDKHQAIALLEDEEPYISVEQRPEPKSKRIWKVKGQSPAVQPKRAPAPSSWRARTH